MVEKKTYKLLPGNPFQELVDKKPGIIKTQRVSISYMLEDNEYLDEDDESELPWVIDRSVD